jgi:hypothetical protein
MRARKWYPVIASAKISFRRSLNVFETFELTTQVIGWDDKWLYIEHRMERGGKVMAQAFVKGLFLGPDGKVPMAELIGAMGHDGRVAGAGPGDGGGGAGLDLHRQRIALVDLVDVGEHGVRQFDIDRRDVVFSCSIFVAPMMTAVMKGRDRRRRAPSAPVPGRVFRRPPDRPPAPVSSAPESGR